MDTVKSTPANPGVATLAITSQNLVALPAEELWSLRTAVSTLVDVACACSCQPKFINSSTNNYNRAGDVMEQVIETFNSLNGAINDEAERRLAHAEKLSADDAEMLGFVHLGYVVELRDNLSRVAVEAASAVAAERTAAFHSSRKAGA